MTLILGTIANGSTPHVVVSADGISIATRDAQPFVCSGTTRKVWHFHRARSIVAHFGLNKLWDEANASWVGIADELGAMSELDPRAGFGTVSHFLVESFDQRVVAALERTDAAPLFAFWVATIDESGTASIEELCWERSDQGGGLSPKWTRFGEAGAGIIAAAGDGVDVIRPLLSERIDDRYYPEQLVHEGVEYAVEYHRRFMIAGLLEQARQAKMAFGGKFLTVAITADGGKSVTLEL